MIYKAKKYSHQIYTTGAFLHPQKAIDISGNVIWVWTVVEFTDDSFKDGEVYNPPETANSYEKLIMVSIDEELLKFAEE
jgi:hypothetical protein